MKSALTLPISHLDEQEQAFVGNIRSHGWTATHVAEDEEGVGFTYTTGFWLKFGIPELIIFSVPSAAAHQVLWNFYNHFEAGEKAPVDAPIDNILDDFDVIVKPVLEQHFHKFLGWSQWFYGGNAFETRQVYFPDKNGTFPWEPHASASFRALQPFLNQPD